MNTKRTRTRIREGLWLLAAALLTLPLVADRVTDWFIKGVAGFAGFTG